MRILITGFDPFGNETVNPAYEAVKLLPDRISGAEIVKVEIPTVFGKCDGVVREAILAHEPHVVLSIGQAGGRFDISVELVAVNIADGRIPDNEGNQPVDQTIRDRGENAYFATLPVKTMVDRIRAKGIPASVSYTAGSYVCNYIMYCVLHMAATEFPGLRAGFIHVPFMPSQAIGKPASTPTMSIETTTAAIEAAVEAIVEGGVDSKRAEGPIS
jgi:pyroglutamyl-peptidase